MKYTFKLYVDVYIKQGDKIICLKEKKNNKEC